MNSRTKPGRFSYPVADWPGRELPHLEGDARIAFENRRNAVLSIANGLSYRKAYDKFGIAPKELIRHIDRCQQPHDDGDIWGFRALEGRMFIKPIERKKPAAESDLQAGRGAKGLFKNLLKEQSLLADEISRLAKAFRNDQRAGKTPRLRDFHWDFVKKCKEILKNDELKYPLNLRNKGFDGFVIALKAEISAQSSKAAAKESSPSAPFRHSSYPYSDVEIDAHKLDSLFSISIDLPTGGRIKRIINRLNVLVAKDRVSRAILSWILVVAREVNHLDILRCIRKVSAPWTPREIIVPGLEYTPGAGFPSGVLPHCRGRMADRYRLDNAMAHIAIRVRSALQKRTGASVNWGDAAAPNERAFIESLFSTLTQRSIQPLPTGFVSSTSSIETAMKRAEFESPTIPEMEDYLDVVLSATNAVGHSSLFGETPLQVLTRERDDELIRADFSDSAPWRKLTLVRSKFRVVVDGRVREHVNFADAKYTGASLSSMRRRGITHFDGYWNLEDMRAIDPCPIDGWRPEPLTVEEQWASFPHDIQLRKLINSEKRNGGLIIRPHRDALSAFKQHLVSKGVKDRRAATALARVEQGPAGPTFDEPARPMKRGVKSGARILSRLGELAPVDLAKGKK